MFPDLLRVWQDTRLIVLVAQTAAIYAAVLIPFKVGIPLIPGFAELRPANALPIVASLLLGPVAAWGAGIGNVIADCFGTLSPASLFGFLGNFCYGYLPYLLWGRLGPLSSGRSLDLRSWRRAPEFVVVCFAASAVCALVIAWGVDLLGLVPFGILAVAIFLNNFVMSLLLAPPLLLFLAPRVTRWGLRYEDIKKSMEREAIGTARGLHEEGHGPKGEGQGVSLVGDSPLDQPLVRLDSVTFTYHGMSRPALDGVTLSVNQGESIALMGGSGAGKSTLCYALNGLVPQMLPGEWSGRVAIGGHDTRSEPVWQTALRVGLLFQDFEAQLVSTNTEQELVFPLEHLGDRLSHSARREVHDRIARTLTRVGLAGLERRDPISLSGGQRQRLAIASILIKEPPVIALDAPFTDLDPRGRRTLGSLLAALNAAGTTLIVTEHDAEEATQKDRICVLKQGRLVWEGPPRALFGSVEGQRRAEEFGIQPLPLARSFEGLGLTELPLTVEEAWELADDQGLNVSPANGGSASRDGERDAASSHDRPVRVSVERASYEYDRGRTVLSDVNLTIRDGEFIAIVGQNGSGKSPLAHLLNGLRRPTAGTVHIHGTDSRRMTAAQLAATVGYVFQNPDHQIFAETVEQEVAFGARNLGVGREECARRVTAALSAVGLDRPEIPGHDPFSLTKGDRQRVAVASVLAAKPGILIFDEPTTGLDAVESLRMMDMLRRLNREGQTIIMITHALSLVTRYARRSIIMRDGRIHADGPTRKVFEQLSVAEFAEGTGLEVPPLTRFAARWGQTLLTAEEVNMALKKK